MQHFSINRGINLLFPKQERSYKEIVSILDAKWNISSSTRILKLKEKLQLPKPTYSTILIAGTTGKSTTIYYLSKILSTEGISIASYSSPHYENYNERFKCNNHTISNKSFTRFGNIILNLISDEQINIGTEDILLGMSLLYFNEKKVKYAIVEQENPTNNCSKIYNPEIVGVTRIISGTLDDNSKIAAKIIKNIKRETLVICSDRSKHLLDLFQKTTKEKHGKWVMPVRKAAPLKYPFEQIHGKSAGLAERIAEKVINKIKEEIGDSYVRKIAFQEKTNQGYSNSKKVKNSEILTLGRFWDKVSNDIPNRFELIKTESKTIIVDGGSNIESIEKTLLGARLLDYAEPFKNIHIILGLHEKGLNIKNLMKQIKYHMKVKTSFLTFCTVDSKLTEQAGTAASLTDLDFAATASKINCSTFNSFELAYKKVSKELKGSNELLVIAGSQAIVSKFKEIFKKEK